MMSSDCYEESHNKHVNNDVCHGGKRKCTRDDLNWRSRVELAAAFQLLDHLGLSEGIENHLTLIAPARSGHGEIMLTNAYGTHWSQVTASSLIGVDPVTGETIEGDGRIIQTAISLHRAIKQVNPNATCIMHTHQPYVASLNCLQDPTLLMLHQESCLFHDKIAYDIIYNGVSDNEEEGERLAQVLQDKTILFQSNHGVTAVGPTVAYTFRHLCFLEKACMYQMNAMNTGRPLKEIPLDIVLKTRESQDKFDCQFYFDGMKGILLAKGSKFNL